MVKIVVFLAALCGALAQIPFEHHEESRQVVTSGMSEDGIPKSSSMSSSISFGPDGVVSSSGHVWDGEHGKVWGNAKQGEEGEELLEEAAEKHAQQMHEQMSQGLSSVLLPGDDAEGIDETPVMERARSGAPGAQSKTDEIEDFKKDFFGTPEPVHREPNGLRDNFDDDFKEPDCNFLCQIGNGISNLLGGDDKKKDDTDELEDPVDEIRGNTEIKGVNDLVREPRKGELSKSAAAPISGHSMSISFDNGKFGATVHNGDEVRTYGTHRNMPESLLQTKRKHPQHFLAVAEAI